LIAAGTLASQSSAAPSRAPAAGREGWTIDQSTLIFGEMSVIVCAKGIKATNNKHGMSMLCVAPFKEVVLFSERSKKYCIVPFSQFRCPAGRTLAVVNSGLLNEAPMVQKADATYQQMKVSVFASTAQFKLAQQGRFRAHEIPSRGPMIVECYATSDLKVDQNAGLALCHFFGLPELKGLPVYARFIDLDGDKNMALTSLNPRKTRLSDACFDLPPTYQKVARHEDLFVGPNTADELDLMNLGGR